MQSGDIIGNYRIVRLLGTGGMGAVYEAVHTAIDRRVALKVIHEHLAHKTDTIARFFNEARATNHIEHPSIIQVSDFGHAPSGAPYLVMEFLNGVSLDKRLEQLAARNERLDVATALLIAWQVADALTIAHANGIVHRDGKPTPVPSRNEKGTDWGKRREKRADDPASTVRSQLLHCSF